MPNPLYSPFKIEVYIFKLNLGVAMKSMMQGQAMEMLRILSI
jgi:hypothetical protein